MTEREQAVPESVGERVRRERPDAPQRPPAGPGGRLVDTPDDADFEGEWADDPDALSAEEAALHIEER